MKEFFLYFMAFLYAAAGVAKKGFLKPVNRQMLLVSIDVQDLMQQLKNYQTPEVEIWIDRS